MLQWMSVHSVYTYASNHFTAVAFCVYFLESVFLLLSRRMSVRLEAAGHASRPLSRLAYASFWDEKPVAIKEFLKKQLKVEQERKQGRAKTTLLLLYSYFVIVLLSLLQRTKRYITWPLKKIDWLLYDKLKLLPDAGTGRRMNFFLLLFAAWLASNCWNLMNSKVPVLFSLGSDLAHSEGIAFLWRLGGRWQVYFQIPLFMLSFLFPFFFVRKNREFYFDVMALFFLQLTSFAKLLICGGGKCCFGVPWPWGVYNEILKTTVFPVERFEFAVGALLSVLCVLYMLYGKSYRQGRGCTLCVLSYVVPRFFWEFLRYKGPDHYPRPSYGALGFTMIHVVCAAGAVLGLVWLLILPLEKKWMDRLWDFAADSLRRLKKKQKDLRAE